MMLLLTVFLAISVSFGEMLSKYQAKPMRDIANPYLGVYLALNGIFAAIAYYFLPAVAGHFLKPEQVIWVQGDSWGRVFFAAFGYLVMVRTKVVTIKDTPVGIETLYKTFADYCLYHTNRMIDNRQDAILNRIVQTYGDPSTYITALNDRIDLAPEEMREAARMQRDNVMASNLSPKLKCKRLGQLLLRIVGTQAEVEEVLAAV